MQRLLVQLDGDRHPSVFDRIVGHDAGADQVLSYGGVRAEDVRGLVHGAIFTRGPKQLNHSALFIGGSDAAHAERLLAEAQAAFFGPFRTSIMLDPNGSNTTAAAAVRKVVAAAGGDVTGKQALVLAGTGPVGARVAGLLGRLGAEVRITSRDRAHGEDGAARIRARFDVVVEVGVVDRPEQAERALDHAELVVACGPAGVQLVPRAAWTGRTGLRAIADVNAVPPVGVEGVDPEDDGEDRQGVRVFGALGVGGLKMKLHKASIARLFEQNDRILDAEAIYELAADV
ncbi:MAG: NAD(P)-dependent methylenetetrahydromethanopterin dehydrogenase [Longimicrobiales bacterium]